MPILDADYIKEQAHKPCFWSEEIGFDVVSFTHAMEQNYSNRVGAKINGLYKEQRNLERQLAQAQAVIEQQKEVIEQLQSDRRTSSESFDILVSKYTGCKNQYEYMSDKVDNQSALIETLHVALRNRMSMYPTDVDAIDDEAIAAYTEWKESK